LIWNIHKKWLTRFIISILKRALKSSNWRVALAFDPERKAILLTAGNKAGDNQKRFYKELIATAYNRFDDHLAHLKRRNK
jgi:hypothetical protein